jgi:hypothetical protein
LGFSKRSLLPINARRQNQGRELSSPACQLLLAAAVRYIPTVCANAVLDDCPYGFGVTFKVTRLLDELPHPEIECFPQVSGILRGAKHGYRGNSLALFQKGKSRDTWNVEVEDDEVGLGSWLGQHLKGLFAIHRNAKCDTRRDVLEDLVYKEDVARIVLNQENMSRKWRGHNQTP